MLQEPRPIRAEEHFNNLRRWLDMEGEAERERLEERRNLRSSAQAERGGETLLDLFIANHGSGLGGRYLLNLKKRKSLDRLPWHKFKVGSPIILSSESEERSKPIQGVVSARQMDSVEIAVESWPDGDRFRLDLSPDEVTRKRQIAAMDVAQKATSRLAQLRDILLYDREPTFRSNVKVSPSERLNRSQQDAVKFAMSSNDLAIIHGPPGTGKTSLANQAAFAALERHTGLRLVIANAEMTPRVLINRELCRRAMVNYQALRFATYTAEEKERLQDAGGQLSALMERTELMVGPYSAADLGSGLAEREPGIVIVDYLQKFKPPGVATMEGIESVMDHLRAYAEAGWAVIALSATKRAEGGKHDSAKLDQAAFRGSSEIEFQADAAYVLRDQSGGAEGDRDMILDCVKNRHGNRGSINLRFVAAEMRFESTVQPFDFGSDF